MIMVISMRNAFLVPIIFTILPSLHPPSFHEMIFILVVSIDDMNIMNTSNEMMTLTLPENITENVDIHLLVVALNLCGLESEASENITIPAEGI